MASNLPRRHFSSVWINDAATIMRDNGVVECTIGVIEEQSECFLVANMIQR